MIQPIIQSQNHSTSYLWYRGYTHVHAYLHEVPAHAWFENGVHARLVIPVKAIQDSQ